VLAPHSRETTSAPAPSQRCSAVPIPAPSDMRTDVNVDTCYDHRAPTSPAPRPVPGSIRRRPILGGLLNEYEAAT
jgi:hypothetical protein